MTTSLSGVTLTLPDPDCGDPGEVKGTFKEVTGDPWREGTTVTYNCLQNYKLAFGNLTRTCLASGTWSGLAPICDYVGAMVSAEALIAITGTLAVIVLLLLPLEYLRYKLKQAQGRQILKNAKSARKKSRSATRQNPFMGTPVFSRSSSSLFGDTDFTKQEGLQMNYASNAQTPPHYMPKIGVHNNPDSQGWEGEPKKKLKKKKKKQSQGYTNSNFDPSSGSPRKGKVNPQDFSDSTERDLNGGIKISREADGESHPLRNFDGPTRNLSSAYFRQTEDQRGVYDNHVTLEDELNPNVYSLNHHRLPPLGANHSASSLPLSNEEQHVELARRDLRDFVV